MGLGGITRDSIADLASLVHDDDNNGTISTTNNDSVNNRTSASLHRASSDYLSSSSFTLETTKDKLLPSGDGYDFIEQEEQRCVLNDDELMQQQDL